MVFREWLKVWLDGYVRLNVKERTFLLYNNIVNRHIIDELGDYEIDDITPIIVQQYIISKLESGNRLKNKGLSINTVNCIITIIKTSLKVAKQTEVANNDISSKIQRPKGKEKEVTCLTVQEQRTLECYVLSNIEKKPKYIGIMISLYTGIRIGELLSLRWDDINFNARILHINKTCYDIYNKDKGYVKTFDSPKTINSNRLIPFPIQLEKLLLSVKESSSSNYVISNKDKIISVRSYQKTFELILNKLKINHKGFHSLRHSFATRATEIGVDIKTLSEILGHASPEVTLKRYSHSLLDHKINMMNKIGTLLNIDDNIGNN